MLADLNEALRSQGMRPSGCRYSAPLTCSDCRLLFCELIWMRHCAAQGQRSQPHYWLLTHRQRAMGQRWAGMAKFDGLGAVQVCLNDRLWHTWTVSVIPSHSRDRPGGKMAGCTQPRRKCAPCCAQTTLFRSFTSNLFMARLQLCLKGTPILNIHGPTQWFNV